MNLLTMLTQKEAQQECIPVGCVPAARRPYAGVCFLGGSAPWGGSAPGRVPGPGVVVYLV